MLIDALRDTWLAQLPHPIVSPVGLSLRYFLGRAPFHDHPIQLRTRRDVSYSSLQIVSSTAMMALVAISNTRNTPIRAMA